MRLRNLLHIQENDIHIIGSLTPPFFYRVSDIMAEFIQLCDNNTVETSLNLLKEKYPESEFSNFQKRLDKIKDKVFVNDDYRGSLTIDLSSKIHILTLNVTRKCNLKCDYCFEDSEYRKLGSMSFDVAKKAIDTFFTSQINTPDWVIIFTGGEPLLNYDLLRNVVEYINKKGIQVEYKIKTNATLMDDEKMDFLIKNNFKIQISLDGNEKAHDTHRKFANGKGTFEIVDQAIRKLIKKNYGSEISISGTLTNKTTQYVDDCYFYLNSYQEIKQYSLKSIMPNSHEQYAFDSDDYKIAYTSNLKNNKYFLKQQGKILMEKKNNICGIGIWNITIDVDGTIYPCYRMCGNEKYIIGTLDAFVMPFKLQSELENIYQLENNEKCSKCFLLNICKKGCYTDKLMFKYEIDNCFLPDKQNSLDNLHHNFIANESYKLLYLI
jgi:uncharacterized protein